MRNAHSTSPAGSGRRAIARRSSLFANATGWLVEPLEPRRLLSVGTIPTVPTPAGHWTFDEGTGHTAHDTSGNNHSGSLGSGATWTTGNVGTHAISLNGSSSGVVTVTGPVVNTANSFTASAWVDLNSLSGYQTVLSIAGTNVAGFFLQYRGDTGTFAFTRLSSDATGTATYIADPTAPVTGTWYHIVGVDDVTAGTLTLYVNGQSMGSVPYTSAWQANGNTLIGHGFYSGGQVDYVNGQIDDVELFSSALSAAQVAALDEPAAYSFDDGTGTTAADVSGHGNTLTLGSGASWTTGHIGSNAIAFNGTATGNATYAGPVVNTAQSFSISAWVNLNSLSTTQTFVSIDGTNTSGFYLQYRSDTGDFAFTRLASDSTTAAAYQASSTAAPATGQWYNLIGVNDVATSQILLYVNGVLQSTISYSGGWQANGATVIGGGLSAGVRSQFVNGSIDQVQFFDSPVSADEAGAIGTNGSSVINIAANSTGVTVSPDLFGAFMEDINYGGEGGIYNDEVRNSGFNDSTNALNSWAAVASSGVTANLASDTTTGPTTALTQSGKLSITSGVSATARAGISNSGYFGVAVAPSTSYTVSFYAKATAGFTGPLTVDIESTTGTIWATATVSSITSSWAQYNVTLTTTSSAPTTSTNLLVISTTSPSANGATIWFGATYLYPPSYQNQSNHLRIDLMQMLAALKPAVFRIPGGNYLEGNTYATRFQWSNTIGPVQNRPGHYNSAWGYWSTDGMGLDEYLQMAQEVGASPILSVYAGYTLNGTSDTGATLTADVTDAVNELHYVLDPTTTAWGAERAANGHPAPYNVQNVEIGNEDFFSSTYASRYPLFYDAIHAAFPNLQIIATSSSTGGAPYNVLDEHFYESPAWFEANSNYFNNTTRGSSKVFIGEYAANEGSPTNDMNSALGDSCWLLGLERNSDLVTMSSYAPLWVNVNGHQWTPDLIGFNNTTSYGSPSYWAQVMLSNNHGNTVISDTVTNAGGLQTLVTRTGSTYYLTTINTTGTPNNTAIDISGLPGISSTGTVTTLSASSSNATNSITNPTNITPQTSTVSGLSTSFNYTFPGYSITILQFNSDTSSAPTVAAAASASPGTVTGTTTNLSVLGADSAGESTLTYMWSVLGTSPAVTFTANNSNAAKNTTATFSAAGTYNLLVTITDASGLSTTSNVTVTVSQTATSTAITPATSTIAQYGSQQFTAAELDQFGNYMVSQPTFTFTSTGVGAVSSSGSFASSTTGTAAITATAGSYTASTAITVGAPSLWYRNDTITAGTNVADSSGNGYTGTITGTYGTTYGSSTGEIGNALSLSGSTSGSPGYATAPGAFATALGSMTNFTISAWVDPANLTEWSRVFDFGDNTNTYMFLTTANGSGDPRFAITTGSYQNEQYVNGAMPLVTNTWNFLAVTLSGSVATLYLNGVVIGTTSGFTLNPSSLGVTTQDYLGKSQYSADPEFNGSLDDFRVYGSALSGAALAQMYSQGVAASTAEPSAVTATANPDGTISINWTNNATADTSYLLERSTDSGFATNLTTQSLPANSTTYLDTNVNTGITYYYRVTAIMPGNLNAGPVAAASSATALAPSWLASNSVAVWNPSTQILSVTGAATIIADPGTAEPIVQASGPSAAVALNPSTGTDIHLGGLSLTSGASAVVTSLGSARSLTNYHLLILGTPGSTSAPLYNIDSTSTLDLADNDLAILYGTGTSPLPQVQEELQSSYDTGQWDKPGLTSSIAPSTKGATGLGYATSAELGITTFDNLSLGGNALLVKYTLMGDTTLTGSVTGADYNTVLANFDNPGDWTHGNFHYGGTYTSGTFTNDAVAGQDYNTVLNNYDNSLSTYLPAGAGTPALAPAAASALSPAKNSSTSKATADIAAPRPITTGRSNKTRHGAHQKLA